jgi:hypothetical protein
MGMTRCVEPEWLDEMSAEDPRAVRTRQDLRVINAFMQHVRMLTYVLTREDGLKSPRLIVELGAGDGTLMLRLAHRLATRWKGVRVILVDLHPAVTPQTLEELKALGWETESVAADVFDWLAQPLDQMSDLMLANLFIHHFQSERLALLLTQAAERTHHFAALEPRRSALALGLSRLVWILGCNAVTRHDAVVSVRAGFTAQELSTLWPKGRWQLRERGVGPLTHYFLARRGGE